MGPARAWDTGTTQFLVFVPGVAWRLRRGAVTDEPLP